MQSYASPPAGVVAAAANATFVFFLLNQMTFPQLLQVRPGTYGESTEDTEVRFSEMPSLPVMQTAASKH